MNVCHISNSLKTGGLERVLAGLAANIDRKKCELSFVALSEEGRFAGEIRKSGALVHTVRATNRLQMVSQLRKFLVGNRFDIVHTHNIYPHIYGTLAARLARVPIVINTRHGQRSGHGWKSKFLFRFAGYWVDRIVAVSDDAALLCTKEDGIANKKVTRIWNGIDTSDFAFRSSRGQPIAVCVARLAPEKDLESLIRSIAIAIQSVRSLRLRIIGDGELRSNLEKLAVDENVSHAIEFLGERENVPELLADCGFYVSSSLSEGISLTILEAMAVGLPVIATQIGGNPEIVIQSKTGMLVPVANPTQLAQAIVAMCNRSPEWDTMGKSRTGNESRRFLMSESCQTTTSTSIETSWRHAQNELVLAALSICFVAHVRRPNQGEKNDKVLARGRANTMAKLSRPRVATTFELEINCCLCK